MTPVLLSFKDNHTFRVDAGPRDTNLCKSVPGMRAGKLDVQKAEVEWTAPATWYHANVLRAVFKDRLQYGDEIIQWATHEFGLERCRLEMKHRRPVVDSGPLYRFQKPAVNWLYASTSILAFDMGLGKTVIALQALEHRRRADRGLWDALVVTTNSMKFKWAEEADIWAPSWSNVVVVNGSADKRRKQIQDAPPGSLFVMNWESLRTHSRLSGYGSISLSGADKEEKDLNRRAIHYLIADEAHKAKDPHAKQTRALWAIGKQAQYRWALTGTPLANGYLDLWALLHFCQPEVWPSRTAFQDRYVWGIETQWGFQALGWREENKAELFRFVDLLMLRTSKAEALPDLPEKQYERRVVELTPKQASAYKLMKKEMMAEFNGELLTVGDPLTKATRLLQIASATPVVQDGQVVALHAPSNKVQALLEICAESDQQLVVFAASRKLIDLCEEALNEEGVTNVRITGIEGPEVRALHVQQFQEGLVRVALCTFGAGAEGITLTAASTAVFLQRPWSLVQSRQAEDRIHRIGQAASKVLIIDVVSKGTLDVAVWSALVEKGQSLESVVRDKDRLKQLLEEA